jgi:hypothetical protein
VGKKTSWTRAGRSLHQSPWLCGLLEGAGENERERKKIKKMKRKKIIIKYRLTAATVNMKEYCSTCLEKCYFRRSDGVLKFVYLAKKLK